MKDKQKKQERYMKDPFPKRLGGLSATLARLSSSARHGTQPDIVQDLLEEAKYYIEWTAADAKPEVAAEMVNMQRLIVLWQKTWAKYYEDNSQKTLLSTQAKIWSDKTLELSGLI